MRSDPAPGKASEGEGTGMLGKKDGALPSIQQTVFPEKGGAGVLKSPNPALLCPSPAKPGMPWPPTWTNPPKPLEAGVYFRIARLLGDWRWDAVASGRPAPSRTEGPVHWPADTSPRRQASSTHPANSQPPLASLGPGVHTLVAWGCLGPVHPQQELEEGPWAPGGHISSVLSPPCSMGRGGHWQGSKGAH